MGPAIRYRSSLRLLETLLLRRLIAPLLRKHRISRILVLIFMDSVLRTLGALHCCVIHFLFGVFPTIVASAFDSIASCAGRAPVFDEFTPLAITITSRCEEMSAPAHEVVLRKRCYNLFIVDAGDNLFTDSFSPIHPALFQLHQESHE